MTLSANDSYQHEPSELTRLRRANELLRDILGRAYIFISPHHDPMPFSNVEMAAQIKQVLSETK